MTITPPKILEPRRRQLSVAHGVLNVAVAEIGLQGARIVSSVRERVAAGVPERVRVSLERQLGDLASSLDHSGEPGSRERRAALRGEHLGRTGFLFALEAAEGT